jgi:hypothetical protein
MYIHAELDNLLVKMELSLFKQQTLVNWKCEQIITTYLLLASGADEVSGE